jgi:hypothetical protein
MVAHRAVVFGFGFCWGGDGCFGRWARRLVFLVLAGVGLALVLASGDVVQRAAVADRAARGVSGALALGRLQSLPVQGQSVISAALGSGQPGFAARRVRLGYQLRGGGLLARLGAHGEVDLRAGGLSVSLTVVGVGRGRRLSRPGVVSVSARENRVVYDRGSLREWYVAGPLGIEQGFTLARRPAGASAPLSLTLGVAGSLRAQQTGSRVRFLARSGAVALRYGGLSVTDASGRRLRAALALHGGTLLVHVWDRSARYPLRIDPLIQQGPKLTPSDATGPAEFGYSVALSADGTTALIGGRSDNGGVGAAWVFTHSGSTWTQQGPKLTPGDETGAGGFGFSVALSADGNTALIGGPFDGGTVGPAWGAAWVFTRSGSTWTQQGPKLTANDEQLPTEQIRFGRSVALSADGNTALIGSEPAATIGGVDAGAAWVFTRSGSTWTQQGAKLDPNYQGGGLYSIGSNGGAGWSVALSADGNTALISGPRDNSGVGAAWVFTRSGSTWTRPGPKLTPSDETGAGGFGDSVALSADGNTALIGGPGDTLTSTHTHRVGAAWVFTRSGSTWTQQGPKVTASDETGGGAFGTGVALSADGNRALIAAPDDGQNDEGNDGFLGAAWMFTRSGSTWTQQGPKLTASDQTDTGISGGFGYSAALSADGTTALIGGPHGNLTPSSVGSAWVFAFGTPHPTITAVKCNYKVVVAQDTCTATVRDSSGPSAVRPGGRVQFRSGSGGVFSAGSTCNLSPSSSSNVSSCSVQFIPPATGAPIITGHYLGDGSHLASSANTSSLLSVNVARPIVSGSISPGSFFAARSGRAVSLARVYGAIVRVRLRAPARVVFTVQQPAAGRRDAHNRCVAPTRNNRRRRACTRYLTLRGNFSMVRQAGLSHFRFRGRIGARTLKPGSYRLVSKPYIGKIAGVPFYITFRIKQ